MSLHASGRAVDMKGNPSCIYAHLHGWPGGYSIDYGRVHHVHISLGGREDGLRFAHGGHRRHYAHRRHHRYAMGVTMPASFAAILKTVCPHGKPEIIDGSPRRSPIS